MTTRELNITRDHMMSPQEHVCDGLTRPAWCADECIINYHADTNKNWQKGKNVKQEIDAQKTPRICKISQKTT